VRSEGIFMSNKFKFSALVMASLMTLSVVALPVPTGAAARHSPPLVALTRSVPGARSGQPYRWKLQVEGGTKPYRCVAKRLDIGNLSLEPDCWITGTASVVSYMSVTGPFRFKVEDSSTPRKTAEFPSMNFTVRAPLESAVPVPPADFQVIASVQQDQPSALQASATIANPVSIDVRFTGSGLQGALAVLMICTKGGQGIPALATNYNTAGLYSISVPAGADSCDVTAMSVAGNGLVTIQIYSSSSVTPTTTTTTPTTTKTGNFTGTWSGTYSATDTIEGCPNAFVVSGPVTFTINQGTTGQSLYGDITFTGANIDYYGNADSMTCTITGRSDLIEGFSADYVGLTATGIPGNTEVTLTMSADHSSLSGYLDNAFGGAGVINITFANVVRG